MKTINLIKIAAVILIGIAMNGTAMADNDKYSRTVRLTAGEMIRSIMLTGADVFTMEDLSAQPVEDWMFESDYLSEEPADAIEPWMLETDYLDEDVQPLESWMFNEMHLTETAAESSLEPWMFESGYLSR
jgi:hypothetical protein